MRLRYDRPRTPRERDRARSPGVAYFFRLRAALLRLGTFAPECRASLKPIAMACFRLVTFLPERPDLSFPSSISRIASSTSWLAVGPYFRVVFLRAATFYTPVLSDPLDP